MSTDITFNEKIIIDRNDLESECEAVPGFFDYWIRQESDSESQLKNYAGRFKRNIRRLDIDEINTEHGLSISRVTEGVIDTLLEDDSKYQELREWNIDATAQRKSYSTKIDMLKVLAQLHGQGYFAKIESSPAAMDLIIKEIRRQIAESIKARPNSDRRPQRPQR